MTGAAEPESGRAGAWRRRLADYIAPALVLLAIIVPFLRYHGYSLLLPESLILMGGAAFAGLIVGALARFRPATLGPALMALTLCVYIIYRPEIVDLLPGIALTLEEAVGNAAAALGALGVGLFLVLCLLCWLLRQHLGTIVAAIFGTIILSSVLLPVSGDGKTAEAGALPQKLNNLPPVVHLILDEHIGLAGLPPELPESAEAARIIEANFADFALYNRAFSRFAETRFSLGSLMNNGVGTDVVKLLDDEEIGFTLKENVWFDRLKEMGYAVRVYQSAWLDMCSESASVDSCYTYPLYSPDSVQRSSLSLGERLQVLLARILIGQGLPGIGALASADALDRFRSDLEQAPQGVAYILHLLIPHDGYLYRSDCTIADPGEWKAASRTRRIPADRRTELYRLYLQQLICTQRKVGEVLDELKKLGVYDKATIIVHGDHGSRIGERPYIQASPAELDQTDLIDHFATLLAAKFPGNIPGIRDEPTALQDFFARTFLDGAEAEPAAPETVLLLEKVTQAFATFTLRWPGTEYAAPPTAKDRMEATLELDSLRRGQN